MHRFQNSYFSVSQKVKGEIEKFLFEEQISRFLSEIDIKDHAVHVDTFPLNVDSVDVYRHLISYYKMNISNDNKTLVIMALSMLTLCSIFSCLMSVDEKFRLKCYTVQIDGGRKRMSNRMNNLSRFCRI